MVDIWWVAGGMHLALGVAKPFISFCFQLAALLCYVLSAVLGGCSVRSSSRAEHVGCVRCVLGHVVWRG